MTGLKTCGHETPLAYLACPYSHPSRAVRIGRFHAANAAAAMLMASRKALVFSPISHSHPICEIVTDDNTCAIRSWDHWKRFDEAILSVCGTLYVLPLPGWEESVGVQAEISLADKLGIEVEILPKVFIISCGSRVVGYGS